MTEQRLKSNASCVQALPGFWLDSARELFKNLGDQIMTAISQKDVLASPPVENDHAEPAGDEKVPAVPDPKLQDPFDKNFGTADELRQQV